MSEEDEKLDRRGGRRPGAGRKPTYKQTMGAVIAMRCSVGDKEVFLRHVHKLSLVQEANGMPKLNPSEWLRELVMSHLAQEGGLKG